MKRVLRHILLFLVSLALITIAWFGFAGYERYTRATEDRPFAEVVEAIETEENYVQYKELPKMYIKAVISIEDKRFETHPGIDPIGIARALWTDLTTMSFKEGGSTITQQLMKNLYFDQEKDIARKFAEVFAALAFEKAYDKETIFALYANTSYFGNGYYGIREAANGYFDKTPAELSDAEAIILAGLPQAPSLYDPTINKDLCLQRMNQVLQSLEKDGILRKQDVKKLQEEAQSFFLLKKTRRFTLSWITAVLNNAGSVSIPPWQT